MAVEEPVDRQERVAVLEAGGHLARGGSVTGRPTITCSMASPSWGANAPSATDPMLRPLWSLVAGDLSTAAIERAGHWRADENPESTARALGDVFAQA